MHSTFMNMLSKVTFKIQISSKLCMDEQTRCNIKLCHKWHKLEKLFHVTVYGKTFTGENFHDIYGFHSTANVSYELWPCPSAIEAYRNHTGKALLWIAIFHSRRESFPQRILTHTQYNYVLKFLHISLL